MVKYKANIASGVRRLRKERRWTQAQFAKLLGLSQPRFSEIERGRGSFTAEQFLIILQQFKVPLDYFVRSPANTESKLLDALARLGAPHLKEDQDILPSERLTQATDVIREALLSAESSRLITSIIPVLVLHARQLDFRKMEIEFRRIGLFNRLGWLIENTLYALREELQGILPKHWSFKYRQAAIALEGAICSVLVQEGLGDDILDADITSIETREAVKKSRSEISKRWHIVTKIQPGDFIAALRSAREND